LIDWSLEKTEKAFIKFVVKRFLEAWIALLIVAVDDGKKKTWIEGRLEQPLYIYFQMRDC
jgi:hypothetical protein